MEITKSTRKGPQSKNTLQKKIGDYYAPGYMTPCTQNNTRLHGGHNSQIHTLQNWGLLCPMTQSSIHT